MKKQKPMNLKQIENNWNKMPEPSAEAKVRLSQLRVDTKTKRELKDTRMTIRAQGDVLERLKMMAAKSGIPYQTLIGSILFRYSTDQLVDVAEARKIFRLPTAQARSTRRKA